MSGDTDEAFVVECPACGEPYDARRETRDDHAEPCPVRGKLDAEAGVGGVNPGGNVDTSGSGGRESGASEE